MKTLTMILVLLISASLAAQQTRINPDLPNPNIREHYDRFSDLTSVTLDIALIGGYVNLGGGSVYQPPSATGRDLTLMFTGIVEGSDLTKGVPRVTILIDSGSTDWIYLRGPNLLQVIIDDKQRATLGELKRVASDVMRGGRGVVEQLRLDVPFSVVQKLGGASRVEIRTGPDEVELTKRQLLDIQDWIRKFPGVKGASPITDH